MTHLKKFRGSQNSVHDTISAPSPPTPTPPRVLRLTCPLDSSICFFFYRVFCAKQVEPTSSPPLSAESGNVPPEAQTRTTEEEEAAASEAAAAVQPRRKSVGSSDEAAAGGGTGGKVKGAAQKQSRACMAAASAVLQQLHTRVLSEEEMTMLDKVGKVKGLI